MADLNVYWLGHAFNARISIPRYVSPNGAGIGCGLNEGYGAGMMADDFGGGQDVYALEGDGNGMGWGWGGGSRQGTGRSKRYLD